MAKAPVVSNTTPLIKLAGIELLDLLPQVYGTIWIPQVVRDEYAAGAKATDPVLEYMTWVTIVPNTIPDPSLPASLDAGESASITLALTHQAQIILLDELQARRIAQRYNLAVVGTLGTLVRAKHLGLLPEVKPVIDIMIAQGRWISPHVRLAAILQAGEQP